MVRVSRGIIKIVKQAGGNFDDYRHYVIARHHFADRSGIFSLDELCDCLNEHYDYSSLHHRAGNDRRRFKARLAEILNESLLFTRLEDGRYKTNSERKLLSRYNGGSRTGWYELNDPTILNSRRLFFDFCVGTLLAGNKFRANKNIATYCKCSVRRIQFATSRNHKADRFHKRYNFIEDYSGTWEDVQKMRAIYLNVHGITSPLPVPYKDEWVMRLNAPNTYSSFVLSGVKGDKAQPTIRPVRKKEPCWFKPVKTRNRQRKLFDDYTRRWVFNSHVYDAERYVQDHGEFQLY